MKTNIYIATNITIVASKQRSWNVLVLFFPTLALPLTISIYIYIDYVLGFIVMRVQRRKGHLSLKRNPNKTKITKISTYTERN